MGRVPGTGEEEASPLSGGNVADEVVRVGDTVRKPAGSGRLRSRRCSRTWREPGSPGRRGRWAAMVKGGRCSSTCPGRWPWTSRGWMRPGCTGWDG